MKPSDFLAVGFCVVMPSGYVCAWFPSEARALDHAAIYTGAGLNYRVVPAGK